MQLVDVSTNLLLSVVEMKAEFVDQQGNLAGDGLGVSLLQTRGVRSFE